MSGRLLFVLILGVVLLAVGVLGQGESERVDAAQDGELSSMCSSLVGVGECRVMVTYDDGGEVYAVAVLCEGAESDVVKGRIYELVGSLYGIGTNRIAVLKLDSDAQK